MPQNQVYAPEAISAMLEKYERDSFLFVDGPVFEESDFLNLKNYLFSYVNGIPERLRPTFFSSNPYIKGPAYADWIGSEPILNLLEPVIGPDIAFVQLSICYKPARSQYRVPLHTDSYYSVLNKTHRPGSVTNLFISFSDCTEESGCLRLIPGINEHRLYRHKSVDKEFNFFQGEIDDPEVDRSKLVNIEMKPNQACIFKHSVIHESGANRTDTPRLGLTLRYASTADKMPDGVNAPKTLHLINGKNLGTNNYLPLDGLPAVGGFSWSKK